MIPSSSNYTATAIIRRPFILIWLMLTLASSAGAQKWGSGMHATYFTRPLPLGTEKGIGIGAMGQYYINERLFVELGLQLNFYSAALGTFITYSSDLDSNHNNTPRPVHITMKYGTIRLPISAGYKLAGQRLSLWAYGGIAPETEFYMHTRQEVTQPDGKVFILKDNQLLERNLLLNAHLAPMLDLRLGEKLHLQGFAGARYNVYRTPGTLSNFSPRERLYSEAGLRLLWRMGA